MNVTKLTALTREDFLTLFTEDVHDQINTLLDRPDVAGVVCFENLNLGSPELGQRSALIYGPGCENKTIDDLRDRHLGDVLGRFQWPVHYYQKP